MSTTSCSANPASCNVQASPQMLDQQLSTCANKDTEPLLSIPNLLHSNTTPLGTTTPTPTSGLPAPILPNTTGTGGGPSGTVPAGVAGGLYVPGRPGSVAAAAVGGANAAQNPSSALLASVGGSAGGAGVGAVTANDTSLAAGSFSDHLAGSGISGSGEGYDEINLSLFNLGSKPIIERCKAGRLLNCVRN